MLAPITNINTVTHINLCDAVMEDAVLSCTHLQTLQQEQVGHAPPPLTSPTQVRNKASFSVYSEWLAINNTKEHKPFKVIPDTPSRDFQVRRETFGVDMFRCKSTCRITLRKQVTKM